VQKSEIFGGPIKKHSPKTISDYNCFAVHRAIKYISKDITSISNFRDGNLLLLVNSREVSDKFIKVTSLPGLCDIECKLHNTLNFVKGTINAPCLNNIPENEIVEELKSQNVHSVCIMQSHPHLSVPCTRIFCANCIGEHPASLPECQQYQT